MGVQKPANALNDCTILLDSPREYVGHQGMAW